MLWAERARRQERKTVTKRKNSVALFEVIAKERQERREGRLNVPSWMGRPPAEGQQAVAAPKRPTVEEPAPGEPIVSTSGGRLRLSLNYVSCLVAAGVLLILLLLAFWLGRATVGDSQASPTQASVGDARAEGDAAARVPAQQPTREPGKHYLVIQGMQGTSDANRRDADKIVNYLRDHDVEADVQKYPGRPEQYIVWSFEGFDSPTSREALDYAKMIEVLGERYLREGGRYNFKQVREPWYLRAGSGS